MAMPLPSPEQNPREPFEVFAAIVGNSSCRISRDASATRICPLPEDDVRKAANEQQSNACDAS